MDFVGFVRTHVQYHTFPVERFDLANVTDEALLRGGVSDFGDLVNVFQVFRHPADGLVPGAAFVAHVFVLPAVCCGGVVCRLSFGFL